MPIANRNGELTNLRARTHKSYPIGEMLSRVTKPFLFPYLTTKRPMISRFLGSPLIGTIR